MPFKLYNIIAIYIFNLLINLKQYKIILMVNFIINNYLK